MSLWRKPTSKEVDLVLSSSGVRAPCFIGGIAALEENQYIIKRIAGSSGGALVAAAYALGMSTQQMKEVALSVDYERFMDFSLSNLLSVRNPSVYAGQELDSFYQDLFGNATIKDFEIDCSISVVTIIGRKRILLDRDSYPNLPVWKAVRMSSTIPFIFPYLELGNVPVTDGGLVAGMFDIFPNSPRPVIGLRPRADRRLQKITRHLESDKLFIWNYLRILAEYFLDALDNQYIPRYEWNKTVMIPTFEVGGFNFSLNSDAVAKLIQSGYDATMAAQLETL